ncbi:peptidylprolyl isomerase CPR6 [Ascoidea rubescens DSM 1968]|uniref:Peptidyl-prolyl cis-trans isomerase D n=1 Tax=Ascoidea rubescens DSM 1968 TaxID=1344418 RepID=A0A1D2V9J9_9ASCO|nr:rotamase D [Ascoidea rubescens DSM 1968]ODV58133.1 rotamase D [Ascoidea rubescens DSM 1968]
MAETESHIRPRVYFNISIDSKPSGRLTFELFDDIVPKTAENFRALCTGETGIGKAGKPLWFKGCTFHRIIKDFMIQGGDFTQGNGTGGESIYGEKFDDENFKLSFDKPFYLAMANSGPNTNGSQFFITTVKTPHLDNKHVIFGKLLYGKKLLKKMENLKTDSNDAPLKPCKVLDSNQILPPYNDKDNDDNENNKNVNSPDQFGDIYEDSIFDNDNIDIDNPKSVFDAVENIKSIGTALFKAKDFQNAFEKYSKASEYLNDYFPDDLSTDNINYLNNLKASIYSNLALVALKLNKNPAAIKNATLCLESENLSQSFKSKALYRRALAHINSHNEDQALTDLNNALQLSPNDPAVLAAITTAKANKRLRTQREKQAFAKFFSSK